MSTSKPVHTLILDAGPILKNDPSISSLLAKAERLVTVPAVIPEIRDATTRSRVESTWMPFLDIISPTTQSIKVITDFARRTGDLAVLSKTDIEVLALTFEIESRKNGLLNIRTSPGQQLSKTKVLGSQDKHPPGAPSVEQTEADSCQHTGEGRAENPEPSSQISEASRGSRPGEYLDEMSGATKSLKVTEEPLLQTKSTEDGAKPAYPSEQAEPDSTDSEDWITPSNIQRHQVKDQNAAVSISAAKPMDTACLTSDYAMQNVLLSMNLNLLNGSLQRVRNIKTYILRCHACFEKTKDKKKQFCPRCGKPTLTRVSCSTNSRGEFKMHLKKNMQWNHRGDRYSIPKPVPGRANGKAGQGKGGGKGGWGQSLILAEDQKEYQKMIGANGRRKETDLMNEDFLPNLLTGDRGRSGGRPKIGAGRNVNSKKR
ncbi:MAG: hypothetical protein Q9219_004372 [cf. Caloplaca sp. 3 TL-2023]